MCKLDLKDAYFWVPLSKDYSNMIQFPRSGNLYKFLCLCFVLAPAPRMFLKPLKAPASILWTLNIRIIIHLDGLLLLKMTVEEILMAKDPVITLLEHLDYIHFFFKTNNRFNHIVTGPRVVKKNTSVMLKNYPLDSALHNWHHK